MPKTVEQFTPFLTGSRAYGTPREDSDWDFVVYEPLGDNGKLKYSHKLDGGVLKNHTKTHYSIKKGCLNLMVFADKEQYRLAKKITERLISQKPVDKEEAVKAFEEAGLTVRRNS